MLFSRRCRVYTMSLHHVLDRIRCDDVTEIGGCALYSVVAPEYVLPRHEQYQIRDLLRDAGSSSHSSDVLSHFVLESNHEGSLPDHLPNRKRSHKGSGFCLAERETVELRP